MPITWRDALNVGEEDIDSDHRQLVEMINSFEKAISGPQIDHKAVARLILGLFQYTKDHFEREEALQRRIRYPYYESHCKAHRDVIRELHSIIEGYGKLKEEGRRDAIVRHLASFLRDWLIKHIIESDLRMAPYIKEYNRNKTLGSKKPLVARVR
ncbi:bacteriohemerythrin [Telmatospirillum sp. J64-1]|uniref:bacteriohemerythrin n=1 Tax=Telmatospirillum sp. J64-1 TaxID=2502183 RepID=UPI00115C89CA|nr:hemerythrin family protein [Telmatospirillum sp. J64-1]